MKIKYHLYSMIQAVFLLFLPMYILVNFFDFEFGQKALVKRFWEKIDSESKVYT